MLTFVKIRNYCLQTALGGKMRCNKDPEDKKEHWLDYAEPKYDVIILNIQY